MTQAARDLKVYCLSVTQQQQIDINKIQISKTYQQVMKSSQRDEWIMTMKIKIHDIKKKDLQSNRTIWQEDQDSWWKMSLFDQNQWEQQDSEIQDSLNHSEFSSTKKHWLQ